MNQMIDNIDLIRVINMNRGTLFYQITNSDNKTWLIPSRNTRTAMGIYQPSHWKGRLIKSLLSTPVFSTLSARICNFTYVRCELREELIILLNKVFKISEFDFSIFCGTPSVHQKLTIQLCYKNRILGYCKVSGRFAVSDLFLREQETLDYLHSVGIEDVPICLFNGNLPDGTHVFIQTTKKDSHSKYFHQWGKVHEIFLQNLYDRTRQTILFENSDYFYYLRYLNEHLDCLSDVLIKDIVQTAIEQQMKYKGSLVEYTICHADFTPWNMFAEGNKLFVFDWEYAVRTCPEGLDFFHFFMQTKFFEKHYSRKMPELSFAHVVNIS